jgi:hypothetical protein
VRKIAFGIKDYGSDSICVVDVDTLQPLTEYRYALYGEEDGKTRILIGQDRHGDAACPICTREGKGRSCSDNIDNDCDMLIDCEDADCAGNRACSPGKEGKGKTCSDNVDNDGDGAIDCADTDCASNRSCR